MSTALKKEQLFTSEPVGRAVISLAVPTVIAQLITVIYNYSSGNHKRMLSALKVLLIDCLVVAVGGMALMFFGATPITRLFINDAATVGYGRSFLRIVCLACPTTALSFLVITIFFRQPEGRCSR